MYIDMDIDIDIDIGIGIDRDMPMVDDTQITELWNERQENPAGPRHLEVRGGITWGLWKSEAMDFEEIAWIWGYPQLSSILMGFSIIKQPFWGSPICGR